MVKTGREMTITMEAFSHRSLETGGMVYTTEAHLSESWDCLGARWTILLKDLIQNAIVSKVVILKSKVPQTIVLVVERLPHGRGTKLSSMERTGHVL